MSEIKSKIVIEKDGWVLVGKGDGEEIGLGVLGVDVEIIDKRGHIKE